MQRSIGSRTACVCLCNLGWPKTRPLCKLADLQNSLLKNNRSTEVCVNLSVCVCVVRSKRVASAPA